MSSPFVAVITGASSGIGQAIAIELARRGAKLILGFHRNIAGIQQTVQRARAVASDAAEPGDWMCVACDIDRSVSRKHLVDAAFARFGFVDVWIHAAGADVLTGNAKHLSFEQKLERLWSTDVRGNLMLSRMVAERMLMQPKIAQASGEPHRRIPSMIHLGWDQALHGMEGDSGLYFSAVKAAVAAYSVSLAKTYAPHIRVNCVAPGWIQTEWGANASSEWNARARGESMLERWGCPEDVAKVVAAISMPDGAFVNGQTIAVNGGWQPAATHARCDRTLDE